MSQIMTSSSASGEVMDVRAAVEALQAAVIEGRKEIWEQKMASANQGATPAKDGMRSATADEQSQQQGEQAGEATRGGAKNEEEIQGENENGVGFERGRKEEQGASQIAQTNGVTNPKKKGSRVHPESDVQESQNDGEASQESLQQQEGSASQGWGKIAEEHREDAEEVAAWFEAGAKRALADYGRSEGGDQKEGADDERSAKDDESENGQAGEVALKGAEKGGKGGAGAGDTGEEQEKWEGGGKYEDSGAEVHREGVRSEDENGTGAEAKRIEPTDKEKDLEKQIGKEKQKENGVEEGAEPENGTAEEKEQREDAGDENEHAEVADEAEEQLEKEYFGSGVAEIYRTDEPGAGQGGPLSEAWLKSPGKATGAGAPASEETNAGIDEGTEAASWERTRRALTHSWSGRPQVSRVTEISEEPEEPAFQASERVRKGKGKVDDGKGVPEPGPDVSYMPGSEDDVNRLAWHRTRQLMDERWGAMGAEYFNPGMFPGGESAASQIAEMAERAQVVQVSKLGEGLVTAVKTVFGGARDAALGWKERIEDAVKGESGTPRSPAAGEVQGLGVLGDGFDAALEKTSEAGVGPMKEAAGAAAVLQGSTCDALSESISGECGTGAGRGEERTGKVLTSGDSLRAGRSDVGGSGHAGTPNGKEPNTGYVALDEITRA